MAVPASRDEGQIRRRYFEIGIDDSSPRALSPWHAAHARQIGIPDSRCRWAPGPTQAAAKTALAMTSSAISSSRSRIRTVANSRRSAVAAGADRAPELPIRQPPAESYPPANSRNAPPPVEIYEMRLVRRIFRARPACRRPPSEKARRRRSLVRWPWCPPRTDRIQIRRPAVPKDGFGRRQNPHIPLDGAGPMSRIISSAATSAASVLWRRRRRCTLSQQ